MGRWERGLAVLLMAGALAACGRNVDDAIESAGADAPHCLPDASAAELTRVAPASAQVTIGDHYFLPATTLVRRGGRVTWTWTGGDPHTVTATGGAFDSSPPRTAGTFSFTFTEPGTYPYECLVPGAPMSGAVVVQ